MIRLGLTYLFLSLALLKVNAQQQAESGFYVQANAATQYVTNPQRPEDGTFAWNFLKSFGGGIYRIKTFTHRISIKERLNYSQKGFHHDYQVFSGPSGNLVEIRNNNKLHYLSADGLFRYRLGKKSLRLFLGARIDYLLGSNLPEETYNPQSTGPIRRDDFRKFVCGAVGGLDVRIDKYFSLDLGVNRDISPALRYPDLLIKNWIWSLNLCMNLRRKKVQV
jgi:hypothetical protein